MKILVDETPLCKFDCPFCDERTNGYFCKFDSDECDLDEDIEGECRWLKELKQS